MKCDLAGFTLTDVLLLIGLEARTGELVIESGNNIGSILFHKGSILHAFSPYSRAMGDLLVEGGIITEDELIEMLRTQKKSGNMPLGGLLMKSGKVNLDVIENMVHEQIRKAMKDFIAWKAIRVSFREKEIDPFDRIHLSVHDYLPPNIRKASKEFLAAPHPARETNPSSAASTPLSR